MSKTELDSINDNDNDDTTTQHNHNNNDKNKERRRNKATERSGEERRREERRRREEAREDERENAQRLLRHLAEGRKSEKGVGVGAAAQVDGKHGGRHSSSYSSRRRHQHHNQKHTPSSIPIPIPQRSSQKKLGVIFCVCFLVILSIFIVGVGDPPPFMTHLASGGNTMAVPSPLETYLSLYQQQQQRFLQQQQQQQQQQQHQSDGHGHSHAPRLDEDRDRRSSFLPLPLPSSSIGGGVPYPPLPIRIIVFTFRRLEGLKGLMSSLNAAHYHGHVVPMTIFIDSGEGGQHSGYSAYREKRSDDGTLEWLLGRRRWGGRRGKRSDSAGDDDNATTGRGSNSGRSADADDDGENKGKNRGGQAAASPDAFFHWQHGPVTIQRRVLNAGLKRSVLEAWYPHSGGGEETVAFFEDDLKVSPYWYSFALATIRTTVLPVAVDQNATDGQKKGGNRQKIMGLNEEESNNVTQTVPYYYFNTRQTNNYHYPSVWREYYDDRVYKMPARMAGISLFRNRQSEVTGTPIMDLGLRQAAKLYDPPPPPPHPQPSGSSSMVGDDENDVAKAAAEKEKKRYRYSGGRAPIFAWQQPSSWGALYYPHVWRQFRDWYGAEAVKWTTEGEINLLPLPLDDSGLGAGYTYTRDNITKEESAKISSNLWSGLQTSWKKYMIRFVADFGLFMVYPNLGMDAVLSTNLALPGVHPVPGEKGKTASHTLPLLTEELYAKLFFSHASSLEEEEEKERKLKMNKKKKKKKRAKKNADDENNGANADDSSSHISNSTIPYNPGDPLDGILEVDLITARMMPPHGVSDPNLFVFDWRGKRLQYKGRNQGLGQVRGTVTVPLPPVPPPSQAAGVVGETIEDKDKNAITSQIAGSSSSLMSSATAGGGGDGDDTTMYPPLLITMLPGARTKIPYGFG